MKSAPLALALRVAGVALALPALAYAQSAGGLDALGGGSVPTLTLTLAPQYPQPGGQLVVTPQSTLVDLHDAVVTISQDGAQVYKGNAAPVSLTLPSAGHRTTITATATIAGASYTASATIFPGAVALVEEPLASAPALYPGKPLVPDGGSVRVVAIPDLESAPGSPLSPAALSYTWKQGDATLDAVSGIGKQAIVLPAPLPYRASTLSVAVASQDGAIAAGASLALAAQQPTLRLYADDPLEGILFDNALSGSYAVAGSEAALAAVPYSFAIDQGAPQIDWFLNGSPAQQGSVITLRPTGAGSGTASLSASAEPAASDALGAAAALTISFSAASSGGTLFGL